MAKNQVNSPAEFVLALLPELGEKDRRLVADAVGSAMSVCAKEHKYKPLDERTMTETKWWGWWSRTTTKTRLYCERCGSVIEV